MTNLFERRNTWSNIGYELNTKDVDEALRLTKLDYEVNLQDVFTEVDGQKIKIPDKKAIVRDDGYYYNVMSDKYTVIQNKDAFDFVKYINDDMTIVKAGETYNGLVYMIGKLPGFKVLDDDFDLYTIFQNGHDGRHKLAMSICPLRLVCENQFNLAFKESNNTFNIRHTKNIETKVKLASEALTEVSHYITTFSNYAEELSCKKVSNVQISRFLDDMFPIKETMNQSMIDKIEEEKCKFIKAYEHNDNQNFKGTAWGMINALTDYITHKEFKRKIEFAEEKRFIETIVLNDKLNEQFNKIIALN